MIDLLYGLYEWFILKPWQLLVDLYEWIKVFVLETVPYAVWALIPDELPEFLKTIDFTLLDSLVGIAGYWVPIWEIAAIYATAYGLMAAVRLVRIVIRLIPFVNA